jgi:hypothetical protein
MGDNRKRLAAAMLAGALGLIAPPGADAVLCKRKSGALLLRDACKKKETAVDASAIGTAGPSGAPAPAIRVLDANGRQVGDFTDTGLSVVFVVGELTIQVGVGSDGFTQSVNFLHTTDDCSGDRYLSIFDSERLTLFAGVLGTTAYYASGAADELTIKSIESVRSAADCATDGGTVLTKGLCCTTTTFGTNGAAPTAFDLSGYVPPFRVELVP